MFGRAHGGGFTRQDHQALWRGSGSYAVWSPTAKAPASGWSKRRQFTLPEGLPETPLPGRDDRYSKADMTHPRLWLSTAKLSQFRKDIAADPTHCTWDRIATLPVPCPLAEPRRVFNFLDDQGYDCDLHCSDAEDRSFKVTMPKTFDVGR